MAEIVCDCAGVPPTMPTCRSEHLYDCPVASFKRLHEAQANGQTEAVFNEAGGLLARGDTSGLAAMLGRDVKERAEAAYLRSRANGAAFRREQQ